MEQAYLFIGGSRDGEWRKLKKEEHFVSIPMDTKPLPVDGPLPVGSRLPPLETYRREAVTYSNNKIMFYVYVSRDITGDGMVGMLVENYRRPKKAIADYAP